MNWLLDISNGVATLLIISMVFALIALIEMILICVIGRLHEITPTERPQSGDTENLPEGLGHHDSRVQARPKPPSEP